jgi:thioesterase domain-containing protein/acyl carrier protein
MTEALVQEGVTAFEVRDLYFFRPLVVMDGTPRDIRARLVRSDEGYAFDLRMGVAHKGRTGWQLNAQARLIPQPAEAKKIDVNAIVARCGVPETGQGLPSPQEAHLNFGRRWRVLNSRALGQGEGVARLALPDEFASETSDWRIHPALMDLATGWAMGLIDGYQPNHLWVPVSYGSMRVHGPLPAQIISHVRNAGSNRASDPVASFDVTLADAEGRVCIEVEGFTIRQLDGALSLGQPDPRELEFDEPEVTQLSAAEERLAQTIAMGIHPHEGAEAFTRALAVGLPQIIVSSIDLPALIAQADQAQAARPEGQTFARPDLDSDYVEPRNDIERTLTGFWQDLLGVGQVGVEDDFFALGGHSLIAVRLFAMVRKAYRVDFPISVLFEAPTIAACAALIEDRIGPQDSSAAPTVLKRRFTHLVPMHEKEGGPKRPFFLVAGMFGNVLNLRHLAHLIGGDRPFYGLQARGLYGDAPPHDTIPDAAADYIAELRQVQPQGPYLLGGFSGGGLTAWEMARQLEDAGQEVSLLVLLDTPLPMRPALSRPDKAMIKLAELRKRGPAYLVDWARARIEWERTKHDTPEAQVEGAFHNAAIESAFRAALPGYTLPHRQGSTALFRPPLDRHWKVTGGKWVSAAKEYVFADNDLTPFAPLLEVIEVPGDHDSMVLEPNVRVLAASLRRVITAVEPVNPQSYSKAAE